MNKGSGTTGCTYNQHQHKIQSINETFPNIHTFTYIKILHFKSLHLGVLYALWHQYKGRHVQNRVGDVNWCRHYGNQHGGSLKIKNRTTI